jgi:hypothetical protein
MWRSVVRPAWGLIGSISNDRGELRSALDDLRERIKNLRGGASAPLPCLAATHDLYFLAVATTMRT